ncbi:MAG: TolC family protein [Xanthomonadaceae bacterium]|nr:TolC family protein [Xanthomonadaceae bacterium]
MSRISPLLRALGALLLLSGPAWAEEPLSLPAARRIALDRQPLLEAEAHQVDAARATAVAARQLPDPVLKGGVSDLTATGDNIGTLTRQNDTQFTVGISQAFPRAAKRRLRGERADAESELAERRLITDRLRLEREVGLAWLDVWKAHEARALAQRSEREAQLQLDAVQLAYASGRKPQAEVREARVALELLRDDLARLEQDDWHARSQLSRWLGDAAWRPLPDGPPPLPEPPPLGALLEGLRSHPHLDITSAEVAVAAADVRLAKQAYQSDFSVEVGYGHRPAFSDYVNLQVSVDLPVFTANRQDRGLAARQSELLRAEALREDSYREHAAEARLNHGDWTRLGARLAHFDDSILPEADARIEAARLAWGAGSGSLSEVLAARRAALDARLRRLDLETDRSRHALQLRYLAAREPESESAGVTP